MARSFLERLFSIKNFRKVNISNQSNQQKINLQKNSAPKGKIIIYRKITNKSCNTSPKAKPIDN